MFSFLTLKPEAFGLDISDLSLKVVQLKKKGKFLDLACFGETALKPGIIEKGEVQDEKALAQAIQSAVSQAKGQKITTKYAVASLPEEKGFLQVIEMPMMAEEEIKKAVFFEAENYIPLPVETVYLDCQIITPATVKPPDHLDVLIAALPKKIINLYFSSLKKAGFEPLALEIESQAISRSLIEKEVSPQPLLLIDIGASQTSFIIFSGSSLRFTFSCPLSSQKFTKAIAESLQIDLKKAEVLKTEKGITAKKNDHVFKALTSDLNELMKQIGNCLNYCQGHYHQEIKKVLLCGGGANLKGLKEFIASRINLPVQLGNPWVNILPKNLKETPAMPHQESLRYATALGLALRGIKKC